MNHNITTRKKPDIMTEKKIMALANVPITCGKFSITLSLKKIQNSPF